MQPEIQIVASGRTPIGRLGGTLASLTAPQLGELVIRGVLTNAGIMPERVTDALIGNVLQAGVGQAPARQAALRAGLRPSTRCVTISKVCGSGLEAVIQGARALALGDAGLVVAGGMESMSSAPYLLPGARTGWRLGHQQAVDAIIHDGLWDPHHNLHMGSCADEFAKAEGLTRELQDEYAAESFRRANAAQTDGRFAQEIVPVEIAARSGRTDVISHDEGPAKVDYDKIPKLRPAFGRDGTVTAANASTINDGAAMLVLKRADDETTKNLKPLARIVGYASHSQEPKRFLSAPVDAAQEALRRAQWQAGEVDLWEVNEAFAVVPLFFARALGISRAQLNVRGGAISLGHPIGASGARIVVTLLAAMRERKVRRGIAAICIGGGEGLAIAVENLA
jgi:acetyl-CoA C-acetyltransferase